MASGHTSMDELYMLECLSLAAQGAGYVSPNPLVGAVIVKGSKAIGRGYHRQFGGPHAEVHAIRSAKQSIKGATLYVNLEPCNHFGKTPPCTELIISSGIKRVVVGMKDPNPAVSGKGIACLRKAGIEVTAGVREEECRKLNEAFSKYISTGIPFVTLKIAQTLDGKIADASGNSKWITNERSRMLVHRLRSMYDAALVGAGTVVKDNPELTVRSVKGRNPIRVIIDGAFRLPLSSAIFSKPLKAKTILCVEQRFSRKQQKKTAALLQRGVEVIALQGKKNGLLSLKNVLRSLGSLGIASVMVEGGSEMYSQFIKERLANKLLLFVAPKIFGNGLDAVRLPSDRSVLNAVQAKKLSVIKLDDDILIELYLQ